MCLHLTFCAETHLYFPLIRCLLLAWPQAFQTHMAKCHAVRPQSQLAFCPRHLDEHHQHAHRCSALKVYPIGSLCPARSASSPSTELSSPTSNSDLKTVRLSVPCLPRGPGSHHLTPYFCSLFSLQDCFCSHLPLYFPHGDSLKNMKSDAFPGLSMVSHHPE